MESIVKMALHTDDLTSLLKDEQDMQQALKIRSEFSTFSGLEINRMRSEAMWLGRKQNCTDIFFFFFVWICMEEETQNSWCVFYLWQNINVLLKLKRTEREGWKH